MVGVIDATIRDAGETLDQGPCLQINACFLAFVCDSQLDSHMPHAVFPWRVGLPITPTGFPHALGLNFTWDSMEHGHCSFSLPCFAGYALFVLTVAFLFCWKRVVSQQHDASLQHECMHVPWRSGRRLRAGAARLRSRVRRRLSTQRAKTRYTGRQGRPLILTRCRAYGLGKGRLVRLSRPRLSCRRRALCYYYTRVCCHRLGRLPFPPRQLHSDPTEKTGPDCSEVNTCSLDNGSCPDLQTDDGPVWSSQRTFGFKLVLLSVSLCLLLGGSEVFRNECWNCLLGMRVGEASNPGPPGGAAATKRVRVEKFLWEGLNDMLAKVDSLMSDSCSPSRGRSRSPSPARGRSPQRRAEQDSEWTQVVGRKGNNKGKGKGKGRNAGWSDESSLPREVKFAEDDPGGQLLACLKALILECEVQGTKNLLPKLKTLVQRGTGGTHTKDGCSPLSPRRAVSPILRPAGGGGRGPRPNQVPAGPSRLSVQTPKDAKPQRSEPLKPWIVNQVWWPGKVASFAKFAQTVDMGKVPEADITVATLAEALELKALVVAHGLSLKAAVICKDLAKIPEGDGHGLVSKYVQLHTGVWKVAVVLQLHDELPKWGTQPHVVSTKDSQACVPHSVKLVALRATLPQEYLSEEDWGTARQNPRNLLTTSLPSGVCVRTYGWHEVHDRESVVVGFLQVPETEVQTVLSKSGLRGVFFSPLPPKGGGETCARQPIKWLPRDKEMTGGSYFACAKKEAHFLKKALAYRKGGRANLGLVGIAPDKTDESQVRKRWSAKGIPTGWTPQQFTQVLEKAGWRVLKDVQSPTRPKGLWTFSGAMPEACKSTCWILELAEGKQMLVSPWVKTTPKADRMPIRSPGGWISPKGQKIGDSEAYTEAAKAMEVDETQLDPSSQESGKRAADPAFCEAHGRAAPKAKVTNGLAQDQFGPPAQLEPSDGTLGPQGVKLWDLQGNGNCGFRALGAVQALRNQVPKADIEANLDKLALSLRTKCTRWLSNNKGWQQFWYCDPEATETTEAGGWIGSTVSG